MKTNLLLLLFLFTTVNAFSAVKTWDGGGADTNWATAANWVGDVAPVVNDDLVFPVNAARFSTNNNLGLLTNYRTLTIEGGNYTIGGNAIRLTNGLTVNAGTHFINVIINLGAAQTFTAASAAFVTIPILSVGNFPLSFDGDGIFGIGLITGSGSLTRNGLGATLLAAASNFTGGIILNNGVFVVDANIPNSPVTINSGAVGGQFGFSGFGGTGTIGATTVAAGVISSGTLNSPTEF